jgi:xanthine permease XanP
MAKKPANLVYGVDDSPPVFISVILAIQHICLLFMATLLPVFIIHQLGDKITPEEAQSFISMTMIAGGIASIIQAYKIGPVGSGYFCPSLSGPAYFDASKAAAAAGGLPLLFGMTLLSGALESFFSRVMHKLRFLFPVEVTGLIVAMVGVVVIPISVKNFFGVTSGHPGLNPEQTAIGLVTFTVMIALNVWSKGNAKLFCTLVGITVGYVMAVVLNLIPPQDVERLNSARLFAFPQLSHIKWTFDFTLLIPFIVATICSSFKTVGDIVTCQKINDSEWKRPDMKNISNGILADGLGGVIPGLIGGYGQSTSSANVGMSLATGSTSRKIAIPLCIIFFILAFFPKLAEIFIIMPEPVMGAAMTFSVAFMITTGFQMMMSRMLDARKIFVIGTSLIFGLSVDMLPDLYSNIHPWIRPVFSSTLSLATVSAILLNLIFRIGISKHKTLILVPDVDISGNIFSFMEQQGGVWGARREVILKATTAITELAETLIVNRLAEGPVKIKLSFDEFSLDAKLEYAGKPVVFRKERPDEKEILEEDGTIKLAGFIVYKYTDRIKTEKKDGNITVILHFEH